MTERPEIKILFVGKDESNAGVYAANCPASKCEWSDVASDVQGLEVDVEVHKQWHEDGMPD